MLALLAVTVATMAALGLLELALWTHDRLRVRRERRSRDVPPRAVLSTRLQDDDARRLDAIESDLVAALLAGKLAASAYAEAMGWLADREERYGFTESTLPPSFRADA